MEWLKAHWHALIVGAAVAALVIFTLNPANAADIGGQCCADLEERIAELEATTAKKGNTKVQVTIYGQVSQALTYIKFDGADAVTHVQSNGNKEAETFVGFRGVGKINPKTSAGFVLEIGAGGYAAGVAAPGLSTHEIYTRRAYVFLNREDFGSLSIGRLSQATYGVTLVTLANTGVAHTKLSLRPLTGPTLGSVLDVWDGGMTDAIRYDSPTWQGFSMAASWGQAFDMSGGGDPTGSVWDAALHYIQDIGEFTVEGAVGYREGVTILAPGLSLNVQDVRVWSGSAAVRHNPTGLFLNGSYGNLDVSAFVPGANSVVGWEVQGGIEFGALSVGKTTVFGQYATFDLSDIVASEPTMFGLGVVQAINPAAMDIYATFNRYEGDGALPGTADVGMVGARLRF